MRSGGRVECKCPYILFLFFGVNNCDNSN
jgi:hypothetical protein